MMQTLFKQACLEELQAIKPGNVHAFADGHDMTVHDFAKSAEAASEAIATQNLTLGGRIFNAVEATQNAVHCNTNLGIILLCAPLIHAYRWSACEPIPISLSEHVKSVLESTTNADSELCFKAITLANPAGLGKRALHDVHKPANCTLLEAMHSAAETDLIARQYSNNFADIFEFGVPNHALALSRWERPAWATTYVYLSFLANYLDSHIVRKYGLAIAKTVQSEAKQHLAVFAELENPKNYLGELLRWDADLKARGINPGTSADLTVASLFAVKFKNVNGYV
jgi:triphosphoribosyl-dephospho-CoA synthase